MSKGKILAIVGARPQFIKHYPFERAVVDAFDLVTIHTGQHYDENMSKIFFDQMKMSRPKYMLNIGSKNHGAQTSLMMIDIEKIVEEEKPDIAVVYGDTNSTLAGALVAAKLNIPIAHIEAGLRSFNKEMPEEVNRILTDHVSDLLLVPSIVAKDNLSNEGITDGVYIVGDIMKDLIHICKEEKYINERQYDGNYYYATLHRPYNTDDKDRLAYVLNSLDSLDKKVVFSIHPRTIHAMAKFGLKNSDYKHIHFIDPQGYFDNLTYLFYADGLITDSGGMQKEAYWLEKKCVTIRTETEWVETLSDGANTLVFEDLSKVNSMIRKDASWDKNLYGNGKTSAKICEVLLELIKHK